MNQLYTADSLKSLVKDNMTVQELIAATVAIRDAAISVADKREDTGWRTTSEGKHYKINKNG